MPKCTQKCQHFFSGSGWPTIKHVENLLRIVSKYGQEIPQSQTADKALNYYTKF